MWYNYDHRDAYSRDPDLGTGSRTQGSTERRRGTYVRKARPNYVPSSQTRGQPKYDQESRKRGPKQVWVAKDDPDRHVPNDAFICDTRRKTSTVFDRISENSKAVDPVMWGH